MIAHTTECRFIITIWEKVPAPIYVFYQLKNFYQTNRRYFNSKSPKQLAGVELDFAELERDCRPVATIEEMSEKFNDIQREAMQDHLNTA